MELNNNIMEAAQRAAASVKTEDSTRPIPGRESEMVRNDGGGFSFVLKEMDIVDRFIIMGSTHGAYRPAAQLTADNLRVILPMLQDGEKALAILDRLVELDTSGRPPKKDPALMLLAALMIKDITPEVTVRSRAADLFSRVVRIGSHLYSYMEYNKVLRGKTIGGGASTSSRAIRSWFESFERHPERLAYQAVKYRQRDGWTYLDAVRLSHPRTDGKQIHDVVTYMVGKADQEVMGRLQETYPAIRGFEFLKKSDLTPEEVAQIVRENNLSWEMVPLEFLEYPDIWAAILENMPLMAMIRNLPKMTRAGLFREHPGAIDRVVTKLGSEQTIQRARVHPVNIFLAMYTYSRGSSIRGSSSWSPEPAICKALEDAFYLAFKFVRPTGKRIMTSVDTSASMFWETSRVNGGPCAGEVAAALALVTKSIENDGCDMTAFGSMWRSAGYEPNGKMDKYMLRELNLDPNGSLREACKTIQSINGGGTNIAAPILYALEEKIVYDAFVVYTDNDVNSMMHPVQAMKKYRDAVNPQAKLIVVALATNNITVADPQDAGMLDIAGFDSACPELIANFIRD